MKILYVILTCEKYLNTRVKWQKETWLKGIDDVIYLDDLYLSDRENNYQNAPFKYLEFFSNIERVGTYYDWFFFCDDDTFVYTEKLEHELGWQMRHYLPIMIGFKGGTFDIHSLKITWCSGGAGIAMNSQLVENIQMHLATTERPLVTHETDISLAIWATMAAKDLVVIDSKRFRPFRPHDRENEGIKDAITYHYCSHEDFIRLGREL